MSEDAMIEALARALFAVGYDEDDQAAAVMACLRANPAVLLALLPGVGEALAAYRAARARFAAVNKRAWQGRRDGTIDPDPAVAADIDAALAERHPLWDELDRAKERLLDSLDAAVQP